MKRFILLLMVVSLVFVSVPPPSIKADGPAPQPVPTPPPYPRYTPWYWGTPTPYGGRVTPVPQPIPTPPTRQTTPIPQGKVVGERWQKKPSPDIPLYFVVVGGVSALGGSAGATAALTAAITPLGVILIATGGLIATVYVFDRWVSGASMMTLAQFYAAVVPREYPTEADVEHLAQKARDDAYAIFANTPNPAQCFIKTDRRGNIIIAVVKNGGIDPTTFVISGKPVVGFQSHANSTIYRFDSESGFTHEVMKGLWQPLSPDDWRCAIANKGLIRAAIEVLNRGANPPFALP